MHALKATMPTPLIKIIIVGGLENDRLTYQNLLKNNQEVTYEFYLTDSGREALAFARTQKPDCVLLDFCIFDMDGVQLIGLLNKPETPILPIILLADSYGREFIERGLLAGAQSSIAKSKVDSSSLQELIVKTVSKCKNQMNPAKAEVHDAVQVNLAPNSTTENPTPKPPVEEKQINTVDINQRTEAPQQNPSPPPLVNETSGSKNEQETIESTPINTVVEPEAEPTPIVPEITPIAPTERTAHIASNQEFRKHLRLAMGRVERYSGQLALLVFDIDGFTKIEEKIGAENAEELLSVVAERLQRSLRKKDIIARLGIFKPDEFGILLEDIRDYYVAGIVARRLLGLLATPFQINQEAIQIEASIGIACFPLDKDEVLDFHKSAMIAMFHAKQLQGNQYYYFNTELNAFDHHRLTIINDIQQSYENKKFYLCYQPIFDLHTHEILYQEVIINWDHPSLDVIGNREFIRIAEKSGLMVSIGKWIIKSACAEYKKWQRLGIAPEKILIKLTSSQIAHKNFIAFLLETFEELEFSASCLEFEVLENVFMEGTNNYLTIFTELNEIGINICLENFGTGYSSFNNLKHRSIDTIKISPTFLQSYHENSCDAAVIKAILSIGQNLGIRTIACGVNTQDELDFLLENGCTQAQGNLLSPPLKSEEIEIMLHPEQRHVVKLVKHPKIV